MTQDQNKSVSEQAMRDAAINAGLLPNSIDHWMPALRRYTDAITAPTVPAAAMVLQPVDEQSYKGQRDSLLEFIKHAQVSSGICCCGDDMDRHASPEYCGHNPVDMWDHSVLGWTEQIEAFDRAALSAGPVQAAEELTPMERLRKNDPDFVAHLDRTAAEVATWPAWKQTMHAPAAEQTATTASAKFSGDKSNG